MDKIYAEITGTNTIAIHCDIITAELIYENVCKLFAEYPNPCPENWIQEKRNLTILKKEIEKLLPGNGYLIDLENT